MRNRLWPLALLVLAACESLTAPPEEERGLEVSVSLEGDGWDLDTLTFMTRDFQDGGEIHLRLTDPLGLFLEGQDDDGTIAIAVTYPVFDPPVITALAWTARDTVQLVWP